MQHDRSLRRQIVSSFQISFCFRSQSIFTVWHILKDWKKKLKISSTFSPCGCAKLLHAQCYRVEKVKSSARCLVFLHSNLSRPRAKIEGLKLDYQVKKSKKGLGPMSDSSVLTCVVRNQIMQSTWYNARHLGKAE